MHVWFNYLAYVVWPKGPEWQTWYKRLMCWGNYQAMFNYSRVERSLECFFRDLPKLIGFDFHSLTTMGWNGHFFDVWLTDDVLQCECRDFPSARLIYRQVQTKKPWPWNSISWTWRFSISGLPLWTNKRKRKKERMSSTCIWCRRLRVNATLFSLPNYVLYTFSLQEETFREARHPLYNSRCSSVRIRFHATNAEMPSSKSRRYGGAVVNPPRHL